MVYKIFEQLKVNKNKLIILSALVIIIFAISYLRIHESVIDSDKVVDFLLMKEIIKGDFLRIWYPPDNFLHRIPYVYFFYIFFGSSIKTLLYSSIIDYILMYLIFGLSYYLLLKKLGLKSFWIFVVTYTSFVTYSSFCTLLSNQMANPFGRSIEISLSFLLFVFLLNNHAKKPEKLKLILVRSFLFIIFLGVILFSDPFLTFSFYVPLGAYCFVRFLLKKGNSYYTRYFFIILLSVVFSYLIKFLLRLFGIIVYSDNPSFTTIDGVFLHLSYFTKDLLFMYNANFSSLKLASLKTVVILANLSILTTSIFGLATIFIKKSKNFIEVNLFLIILFVINISSYLFSDKAFDQQATIRYLVLIPFILLFGLAQIFELIQNNKRLKNLLLLVLGISILYATYSLVNNYRNVSIYNNQNGLVKTLQDNKLSYGYAGFWDAGVNTFLSNNSIKVRQVICLDNKIYPFYWATSESWYKKQDSESSSFLIRDKTDNFTEPCSEQLLVNQFGQYNKTIIFGNKTIYVWNYNISEKFDTNKKTDTKSPFSL